MKLEDLNLEQLVVVKAKERILLVTGGPGSGKTATALFAGREAVVDGELADDQFVLYLTFSRSAVNQILRRAPGVMNETSGRIEVHTFHGLAFRLVRAFGRFAGMGQQLPSIQSEAATKLVGKRPGMIVYDDMVPAALRLLERAFVASLVRRRWPVLICDEFQDTGSDQWKLLERLREGARLILLADPDQMIHDFRPDVEAERLETARKLATKVIELPEISFRDPTGTVPALARAVLNRDFDHPSIAFARDEGRLRVIPDVSANDIPNLVEAEISRFRSAGCRQIGVYSFTNEAAARLSGQLTKLGVNNTIVGIPESHGEGMATIATLVAHAAGLASLDDVLLGMATFVTAYTRGGPPPLARQLAGQAPIPGRLREVLEAFSTALKEAGGAGTIADVLQLIRPFWAQVFTNGVRLWLRAFATVVSLTDDLSQASLTEGPVRAFLERIERGRSAGLVQEVDEARLSRVQSMNLHQTKGREADGVIIIVMDGDIFGEVKPYPQKSRLLFVAISRARYGVTFLIPAHPHEVVAPLRAYS